MRELYVRRENSEHLVVTNYGKVTLGIPETIYIKVLQKTDSPIILNGIDITVICLDINSRLALSIDDIFVITGEKILAIYDKGFVKTIDDNNIVHYYCIMES